MYTVTEKDDVSLAKELQHYLTKNHRKYGFIDQGNTETIHGKKVDRQTVSCSG